jgi:hypothetical protein
MGLPSHTKTNGQRFSSRDYIQNMANATDADGSKKYSLTIQNELVGNTSAVLPGVRNRVLLESDFYNESHCITPTHDLTRIPKVYCNK